MKPTRFGLPVAAGFAATFLAATLLPGAAMAQVSDDIVKIGVLTDMNGPASAPTGQGSVTAAQMAIDDFGGTVLGKPISIVVGDHQLKADIGGAIARRWYDVDQVDLIVDVPVSAVGLAVQNMANEKKRLFITHSTGTADFHGKFCSPYAIQWVFDTRALAVGTADAVVKRGGDSWFFITDDYAFGHSLERDASAVVTANGGKVLGSVKPPLATPDLSSFVLQAQASKAKIIGIAAGPPNNMNEIKTGSEFGVFKGGQQMAALLALITDIHGLGLQAAQGAVADDVVLLGHGRQDPRMVEALLRQDEQDAVDVAGRRLFERDALSQRHQGNRHRRSAQGRGEDAGKADRGFLRPQRQTARGQSDGARPLAGAGEDAGGEQISVGLLQDPRDDLRRQGVRSAGPGVCDGEEVTA
ncbi:ABC-type branched-subunit amino acid transport system substrate-binding protein [Bradyrhizobium sp. LB7.2]